MNWKKYEKEILTHFQEIYPETNISFDQKIQGKYSKVFRQIDLLIEGEIAGYYIKIIIDCKHFSRKIDVKVVESFCSMVEDVDAHQGILITQKGYTKGAINRAHYGNQKIELDIINFDELKENQNLSALPYIGNFSVFIRAPFGWVLDWNNRINSFATIHQRGISLKEAQIRLEWMYMEFWAKENSSINIDTLINLQNFEILKFEKKSKISFTNATIRKDSFKTKIRIVETTKNSSLEVTGFIEFEEFIFFIVLFTPIELFNKNLRKLQYILKEAKFIELEFDNFKLIEQYLNTINQSNDYEEKADKYFQIGNLYKEMKDLKSAFKSYKKGIECFPSHYTYLKIIIDESLISGYLEEALKYSLQLFDAEPRNPIILSNLIDIYFHHKSHNLLIELLKDWISKNTDKEILGNLYFHLGLVYHNLDDLDKALECGESAKKYFSSVFHKTHQVFGAIKEFEEKVKIKK